ncbi:MAG: tryptophan synthase subunit alpha [Chloroflexi bacterium]|nr:tryptophan synthase subunit alpha [Chloroflexota bacterium]
MMDGILEISAVFSSTRHARRAALMPYFTLGYPTYEESLSILISIAQSGADLIELGIPFSDPLADGPTIQSSSQAALVHEMTVHRCLELVTELRRRDVSQPLLLMGYYNLALSYGIERFAKDAATAGASGLIIPDLPPEEGGRLEAACRGHSLALVYLLAPTSPVERIELVAAHSTGFIYLVSLAGVTGARETLAQGISEFIARVRSVASLPLAVGFGISTPEQAAEIGRQADGVIVGSALIDVVSRSNDPAQAARRFINQLSQALFLTSNPKI